MVPLPPPPSASTSAVGAGPRPGSRRRDSRCVVNGFMSSTAERCGDEAPARASATWAAATSASEPRAPARSCVTHPQLPELGRVARKRRVVHRQREPGDAALAHGLGRHGGRPRPAWDDRACRSPPAPATCRTGRPRRGRCPRSRRWRRCRPTAGRSSIMTASVISRFDLLHVLPERDLAVVRGAAGACHPALAQRGIAHRLRRLRAQPAHR